MRAAEHEDINLITLLCEATEPGLEILSRDGEWLPVVAGEGQIVVDAGDMLSRCTNEVVPATTHRVVNPPDAENRDRFSMPFFVHPRPEVDLTVMDRFTDAENPPKFPPITAGEFLRAAAGRDRPDEVAGLPASPHRNDGAGVVWARRARRSDRPG